MRIDNINHVGKTKIMKSLEDNISSCRHCHFYQGEGRRGGSCQKLGVPVQGSWSVCPLAVHPFQSSWQNLSGIMTTWQGVASEHESLSLESELHAIAVLENLTSEITCREAS
jgi:hypothetical protein